MVMLQISLTELALTLVHFLTRILVQQLLVIVNIINTITEVLVEPVEVLVEAAELAELAE